MQAYSQDLRDRVLRALERGEGPSEVARRFEVSRIWVYQVRVRFQKSGLRSSLPVGGYRRSRLEGLQEVLRRWITAQPDLTLAEMCERLRLKHQISLKAPALWHQLNKWRLTFKKNPARQRARAQRRAAGTPAVARQTKQP